MRRGAAEDASPRHVVDSAAGAHVNSSHVGGGVHVAQKKPHSWRGSRRRDKAGHAGPRLMAAMASGVRPKESAANGDAPEESRICAAVASLLTAATWSGVIPKRPGAAMLRVARAQGCDSNDDRRSCWRERVARRMAEMPAGSRAP